MAEMTDGCGIASFYLLTELLDVLRESGALTDQQAANVVRGSLKRAGKAVREDGDLASQALALLVHLMARYPDPSAPRLPQLPKKR